MEFEYESRPLSVVHRTRDWQDTPHAGPSLVGPPSSYPPLVIGRRRSSAANVPPAGPPPSQPIPSLPPPSTSSNSRASLDYDEEPLPPHMPTSGSRSRLGFFSRPAASANLSAVASFSQRNVSSGRSSPHALSSTFDHLSDPPPRSVLHVSTSRNNGQHQEIKPDRLLLSPPEPRTPAEARPSSRRALTRALELAREAVKLDSTSDDPHAAVMAYGRSVALLSEVMERVRRGEDSTESHRRRNGRRRSVVAQEEEVRRLKAIHDTYADRMNILSLIYSIPPIPHSPTAVYASSMSASASASAESTEPSSPSSTSPASENSDPAPITPSAYNGEHMSDNSQQFVRDIEPNSSDNPDKQGAIDPGMFLVEGSDNSGSETLPGKPGATADRTSAYHPYSAPIDDLPLAQEATTFSRNSQLSMRPYVPNQVFGRPRASSALPPPPPPPLNALPPAPDQTLLETVVEPLAPRQKFLDVGSSNVASHKRTGSGGRLTSLTEESERYDDRPLQNRLQHHLDNEDNFRAGPKRPLIPQTAKRDSHPLPPLPPVGPIEPEESSLTPRNLVGGQGFKSPQSSPKLAQPRPRELGRSDGWPLPAQKVSQENLINPSTMQGTIYQRRSKMSAPPSISSSPVDVAMPGPNISRLPVASLPSTNTPPIPTMLGTGRSRSSSQPGRRPSLASGRSSPFDQRPPMPQTAGIIGTNGPRKTSYSSKLTPTIQTPLLIIQTELNSPPGSTPAGSLVPPLAFAPNIPTTPTSPLPPAPPSDGLRKPYHMMNLIRSTMTSKTGGYVTRKLHVPQEVWSQGGAKLSNVLEKVRVVEVLCSALEELQTTSAEHFGAGNVSSGLAMGIGGIGRKQGEAWLSKLEDFSSVCDGVVANFGKKLGVGEGFVLKKTTGVTAWGGILARQFDKVTKGKNLDSPAAYVMGLTKLFTMAQLLDEHTKALCCQPMAPAYSSLSTEMRNSAETKFKRASEFFASVVLTFVIRDLSQLLDKYAKKCEKWLEE